MQILYKVEKILEVFPLLNQKKLAWNSQYHYGRESYPHYEDYNFIRNAVIGNRHVHVEVTDNKETNDFDFIEIESYDYMFRSNANKITNPEYIGKKWAYLPKDLKTLKDKYGSIVNDEKIEEYFTRINNAFDLFYENFKAIYDRYNNRYENLSQKQDQPFSFPLNLSIYNYNLIQSDLRALFLVTKLVNERLDNEYFSEKAKQWKIQKTLKLGEVITRK